MKDGIGYVHGYRCIIADGKIDSCWHPIQTAYEITRMYRKSGERIKRGEITTDALRRGLNRGSIIIKHGAYDPALGTQKKKPTAKLYRNRTGLMQWLFGDYSRYKKQG